MCLLCFQIYIISFLDPSLRWAWKLEQSPEKNQIHYLLMECLLTRLLHSDFASCHWLGDVDQLFEQGWPSEAGFQVEEPQQVLQLLLHSHHYHHYHHFHQ